MRRLAAARPAILFFLMAALFLIANRAAYKSFFSDDEFDNLSLIRSVDARSTALALVTPRYYERNFRPVGHLYYRAMEKLAGLHFGPYVASLHVLHLLNVAILWLLLRRFSLPLWAAAAGALFFAFHMGIFDIYWRPAYVYDLLCGTFSMLCLLCWTEDRWLWSLLAFWLAYRSKEVAVMLPAILAAHDLLFGKRRWLRLAPFFAISLWFGMQGLLGSSNRGDYSFHFHLADIARSAQFYLSKMMVWGPDSMAPVALPLLVLLAIVIAARDRFVSFGMLTFAALLLPMLMLSERLRAAYLYVPLIGLAIVIAALATRPRWGVAVAAGLALWLPWNYVNLRSLRKVALSQVEDRRYYAAGLAEVSKQHPDVKSFLYYDAPLLIWGARAALVYFGGADNIGIAREGAAEASSVLRQPALTILHWNPIRHRLETVTRTLDTPDTAYLEMGHLMPAWQLEEGWLNDEAGFRWTRPHATARLQRPEKAMQFELLANIGDKYIATLHHSHVVVSLNGRVVGSADFDHAGLAFPARWKLDPAPAGPVEVSIDTTPPYPGAEPLGIAVVSFGFPSK